MKPKLILLSLAILGLAICALAQEIEGPSEVVAGKPVWYTITGAGEGTSAVFLPSGLLETSPKRIVPGNAMFWAAESGKYTLAAIIADWDSRNLIPLGKEVIVTGEAPKPPDPPNPPNPPLPPKPQAWQIMLFHQSDQLVKLPPAQVEMISGLAFRRELEAAGHRFLGGYDVDAVAKTSVVCDRRGYCRTLVTVPPDLAPWWQAVEGDPMPRLAIAPIDGGNILDFPLPATVSDFHKRLENPHATAN